MEGEPVMVEISLAGTEKNHKDTKLFVNKKLKFLYPPEKMFPLNPRKPGTPVVKSFNKTLTEKIWKWVDIRRIFVLLMITI